MLRCARLNFAEVRECGDEANSTVAAHPEIAHVVEKNHTSLTGGIGRFAEECADDGIIAARFVDDARTKAIMRLAKAGETITHAAAAQIGAAGNDQPCGLTTSMRIHYLNAHLISAHHGMSAYEKSRIYVEIGEGFEKDIWRKQAQFIGGHGTGGNGDGTNTVSFGCFDIVTVITDEKDAAIVIGVFSVRGRAGSPAWASSARVVPSSEKAPV